MPVTTSPFLDDLAESSRSAFVELAQNRQVPLHGSLLSEGEVGQRVWAIRSGLVRVTSSHSSGHLATLALRGPGDLVGELAALDGRPRSASVVALRPTVVLTMSAETFRGFLQRDPSAALVLMRSLATRLRDADDDRLRLAADTVPVRLAGCVLALADRFGLRPAESSGGAGGEIELPLSQEDLASMVGASRDAVAKTLRLWRDAGVVTTGRRRLVITDRAALTRIDQRS